MKKDSRRQITKKHLRIIWPNQSFVADAFLYELANELTNSLVTGKIDSELRISHFLAQVKQEVGPQFRLDENLNYRERTLISMFSFYKKIQNWLESMLITQKAIKKPI